MHEAYMTEIYSIWWSVINIVHISTILNSQQIILHPIPDYYKPLYAGVNRAVAAYSPQIIIAHIFANITLLFLKLPCSTLK